MTDRELKLRVMRFMINFAFYCSVSRWDEETKKEYSTLHQEIADKLKEVEK